MNSFKPNNSSGDRVDPKSVNPSRHSVFIRGFPSTVQMEQVRTHFKNETGENCKIDFFSYSDDRKKLFLALRFESHEKAVDVIESYDGKEILGYNIEVSWFKDLRKARKKLIEDERSGRCRGSRSPIEWTNNMNRPVNNMTRVNMWSSNRYLHRGMSGRILSRALNGCGRYRDNYMGNRRSRGVWRRARLSPHGRSDRRDYRRRSDPSESQSRSRSRSRSRSITRSLSSKRKRSYSSESSHASSIPDKNERATTDASRSAVGHDSVHRYHIHRSNSILSNEKDVEKPNNSQNSATEINLISNLIGRDYEDSSPTYQTDSPKPINLLPLPTAVNFNSESSDSTGDQVDDDAQLVTSTAKKHHRKSKKKSKKKRNSKKSKEDDKSSDSEDDQRCIKFHSDNIQVATNIIKEDNCFDPKINDTKLVKTNMDQENLIKSVEINNLTPGEHIKVLAKKESFEKTYKKECETIASVAKIFINKKPELEEDLLSLMKSVFQDISDRYIDDLRTFITDIYNDNSNSIQE